MSETTTMLTDYALAVVTAVLGAMLIRRGRQALPVRIWGWAFVALAVAGLIGGTWHGLRGSAAPGPLAWLWMFNEWAIGLFGFGAAAATILAAFTHGDRRVLLTIATVGFLVFLAWTWGHDRFSAVLTLDVVVMVFVLFIHGTALRNRPASPWIVAGIAVSAVAAVSQTSDFVIGPLNHNDIFHLIQLAGMVLLFEGARRLGQVPAAHGTRGNPSPLRL